MFIQRATRLIEAISMTRDISIICGDGGLHGSFIGGALSELIVQIPNHFQRVKTIYACSASFGSASYYLSHEHSHPGRKIWTRAIPDSDFLTFRGFGSFVSGKPIFNVNILADDIFKRSEFSLNVNKILSHEIELIAPVYDLTESRIIYFTNHRKRAAENPNDYIWLGDVDYHTAIKAVKAAPVLYDRAISIDGHPFCDAGVVEPFNLHLPSLSGTKRILIAARLKHRWRVAAAYWIVGAIRALLSLTNVKRALGMRIYMALARKPLTLRRLAQEVEAMRGAGELYVIAPKTCLPSSLETETMLQNLSTNYEAGENQVRSELDSIFRYLDVKSSDRKGTLSSKAKISDRAALTTVTHNV